MSVIANDLKDAEFLSPVYYMAYYPEQNVNNEPPLSGQLGNSPARFCGCLYRVDALTASPGIAPVSSANPARLNRIKVLKCGVVNRVDPTIKTYLIRSALFLLLLLALCVIPFALGQRTLPIATPFPTPAPTPSPTATAK